MKDINIIRCEFCKKWNKVSAHKWGYCTNDVYKLNENYKLNDDNKRINYKSGKPLVRFNVGLTSKDDSCDDFVPCTVEEIEKKLNNFYRVNNKKVWRKVKQYDMSGNFVEEYASASDAIKLNNLTSSELYNNLNGITKFHKNFQWRYDGDEDSVQNLLIPVKQFDVLGNFIKEYADIKDASIEMLKQNNRKCDTYNCSLLIKKACEKKNKTSFGFLWRFADDNDSPVQVNNKSIMQFTLSGDYVNIYPSANHARIHLKLPKNASCYVKRCCDTIAGRNTKYLPSYMSYGFIWCYYEDRDKIKTYSRWNSKILLQLSPEKKIINKYNSLREAEKKLKKAASTIKNNCDRNKHSLNKLCKGFYYIYKEDYDNFKK